MTRLISARRYGTICSGWVKINFVPQPHVAMLEKKELFEIMRGQNYWYVDPPPAEYVRRTEYLENIRATLGSKSITVIRGPRRAGKTVLIPEQRE